MWRSDEGVAPYRGYWHPEDLDKTNFEIFNFFAKSERFGHLLVSYIVYPI